jgi:hypothetical protein
MFNFWSYKVWRIGDRGKCPLDYFIRLSQLSALLSDVQLEQIDRSYNSLQTQQRMYNGISFVENSVLHQGFHSMTILNMSWVSEMWGKRLVQLNVSLNSNETCEILINWNNGKGIQKFSSSDNSSIHGVVQTLRKMKNYHLHISGLNQYTSKHVLSLLRSFILYPFGDFEEACSSIRDALFCNPWQIFFDKFPVYYHGTTWNIKSPADRCGIQSIC